MMTAVQVTLSTWNYPGWNRIPVCIVPSARRPQLIASFHSSQQATPPQASLSKSSTNTCPPPPFHTTTISPRFTLYSLHYSGASAPPSTKPHPLRLDTSLMNPPISRAVSASASSTLVDPSIAGSGNGPHRSSDSVHTYAWLPPWPFIACAGPHAVHVRHHVFTRSFFAPRPCHLSNPFITRVRPAPTQHGQSSSMSPYPHRLPLVYALLSRVTEALRHASHSQTSSRTGSLTRTLSMDVRLSTRSHT
jgi:hypothetical protein